MMGELLRVLATRPNSAMYKFCKVLKECDEDTLASQLYQALAKINRAPPDEEKPPSGQPSSSGAMGPAGDNADADDDEDVLPAVWPDSFDPLRLQVRQSEDEAMKRRFEKAITSGESINVYPMFKKRRGILLLFNNVNFSDPDLHDRNGSDQDQMALDQLFKQLGFKVIVKKNCKAQEMLDIIRNQAADPDHAGYNCFACVVLSHGFCGGFYGVDGGKVYLEAFKSAVDGENCKNLHGKPKIFIIQACQGDDHDSGEAHDALGRSGDRQLDSDLHKMDLHAEEDAKLGIKSDFFTAMATVPRFVSWRVPEGAREFTGTWFIQALVYVLQTLAHKRDLGTLMTRVNRLVSKAQTKHGFKQVCEPRNALRSDFYFFPGLSQDTDS